MTGRMKKRVRGMLAATVLTAAATVQAATLALWENDNIATQTNSTPVDFVDANISAGELELGVGLVAPATTWPNALDSYIYTNVTSLADAIASTHYFSFTVTPNTGKQVDYDNIFTRVTLNDAGDGAGSSLQIVLMSSVTGFADGDEIGSFVATHAAGQGPDDVTVNTNNFDISGVAALQDQPSPVEFRLYVVPNGGSYSRVALGHIFFVNGTDDVRVDGVVEEATTLPVVDLAIWENDNVVTPTNRTPVDYTVAGVSAGYLELGAIGVPGEVSAQWPNALEGWAQDVVATNLTEAVATNRYFSFTVTPDAGKQISFANIATRITVNCGSSASIEFVLMSSETGFTDQDGLGSIIAVDPTGGFATDNGLQGIDISGVAELKDITTEVEFRLYAVLNGFPQSRMAIGHIFFADGADDLVVKGTIENAPYVPATIVGWASISDTVMKLVINAPSAPSLYYPKGTANLVTGFSGVAHSDNAVGPFNITNLTVSSTEGSNKVIYVETTESEKFFGVGSE